MPQTTPERAARWPGMDQEAHACLLEGGWVLQKDWSWKHPDPDRKPSPREKDAAIYLIEEWDEGGLDYAE